MRARQAPNSRWSVVIPFYNEEGFITPTLASIAAQSLQPKAVILVDNASTDESRKAIESFSLQNPELPLEIIEEATPGKASALRTGLAAVKTEFAATCDADTIYPRYYLSRADELFRRGGDAMAAVLAFGASPSLRGRLARMKGAAVSAMMPTQAHSGGYGQSFRMSALRAAGGFDPARWPYCLMDHEIIHRMTRVGRLGYSYDHWCSPSARRANRQSVRWTLGERLLYHFMPRARRDWFFYEYLRSRFEARKISGLNLREKPWRLEPFQAARLAAPSRASDA